MEKKLLRYGTMALAISSFLGGLWGGMIRLGWPLPSPSPLFPSFHGPLMVSGFLGTVISMERAVGMGGGWTYAAPILTGAGSLALLLGALNAPSRFGTHGLGTGPGIPGSMSHLPFLLISLGSLVLTAVYLLMVRLQRSFATILMGTGSLLWLIGNLLWAGGWPVSTMVLWWGGFALLTITGERFQLSRLLSLSGFSQGVFLLAAGVFLLGLLSTGLSPNRAIQEAHLSAAFFHMGVRSVGAGIAAMALWLLIHDIARRTVRLPGLSRFTALSLLAGYVWLGTSGLLLCFSGTTSGGPLYDAFLHALFLGFVFSMIFGHAPMILPSILGLHLSFSPAFYIHLSLLHLALLSRVTGDLTGLEGWVRWSGPFTLLSFLSFFLNTRLAIKRPG